MYYYDRRRVMGLSKWLGTLSTKEENKDLYVLQSLICTVQYVTLLTCPVHQKLIQQGNHLIKGCKYWVKRRELREGWCPEVA